MFLFGIHCTNHPYINPVSNLVKVTNNPITKVVVNQLGATAVVGFTAYATMAVIYDPDFHDEVSKKELIAELWKASYITWKWYMGLGPKPEVKIGIEP